MTDPEASLPEYVHRFFANAWRTLKIAYHATAIICIATVAITAYQAYQGKLVKYSGIATVRLGEDIQPMMQAVNAASVMPPGTDGELPTKATKPKPTKQAALPPAHPDPGIVVPAEDEAAVPPHKPTPPVQVQP